MDFIRPVLSWIILALAFSASCNDTALAGSVTARWSTQPEMTVEQAKNQAIRTALAEGILREGETLVGAPFSADRREELVAYLEYKTQDLVPAYSVSYGTENSAEGSLTVDMHVDSDQLKQLLGHLKRFDSLYTPDAVQLELVNASPPERSLLDRLAKACGIHAQFNAPIRLKLWREGEVWEALIDDAGARTEAAGTEMEQVWFAVLDRYIAERVASAILEGRSEPSLPGMTTPSTETPGSDPGATAASSALVSGDGQAPDSEHASANASPPSDDETESDAISLSKSTAAKEETGLPGRPAFPSPEYPVNTAASTEDQAPASSVQETARPMASPDSLPEVPSSRPTGGEPKESTSLPVVQQGTQSVVIRGWTVPDGVTAMDRQLQAWQDVLAASSLLTMEMRPEDIIATWNLAIQNGQALETRLRAYCQERGLRYAFGR